MNALANLNTVSAPRHLSPAAARMKRSRERRKDGLRCLTIELRATEVEALIRKGFLMDDKRNDTDAVLDALYAHLDRSLT